MAIQFKKFSIKNFLGDLPGMLNDNFNRIKDIFDNVLSKEEGDTKWKVTAKRIEAEGEVKGNTGRFENLYVNGTIIGGQDAGLPEYKDVGDVLTTLEGPDGNKYADWTAMEAGKVEDVKIDAQSIVENKIAVIPVIGDKQQTGIYLPGLVPSFSIATDKEKVLRIKEDGTGVEWRTPADEGVLGMTIDETDVPISSDKIALQTDETLVFSGGKLGANTDESLKISGSKLGVNITEDPESATHTNVYSAVAVNDSLAAIIDGVAALIESLEGTATIASKSGDTITIKVGVAEANGIISNSVGTDITLANVAATGEGKDVVLTGYVKPTAEPANPAILSTDTVLQALAKLEWKIDNIATAAETKTYLNIN